jgi:glycosyltransferase involved in cell wall biosynthesis
MNFSHNNLIYFVTDSTVANKFGLEQIKSLNNLKFNVYLVCGKGELDRHFNELNCVIYQVPFLKREISILNDFKVLLKVIAIIRKLRPKVIVYSTPKASLLGAIAGNFCFVPIRIYQIWGARWQTLTGTKRFLVRSMDRIAIHNSTNIISVSRSIRELYSTITDKPIEVLGLGSAIGVDHKLFYPKKDRSTKIVLGYAGRIAKDKGIEDLLEIYGLVRLKYPNCRLQIIGDIDLDDPVPDCTLAEIISNPTISWIKHKDRRQLGRLMRIWSLQLFPSAREGLGNVIIEAGASGVPTVCWDIVGARDAMPDFCTNLLVQELKIEAFAFKVCQYLMNPYSEKTRQELAKWTVTNFSSEKVLDSFSNYVVRVSNSSKLS